MGKVAVLKHAGDEITLSMVKWRVRRPLLSLGKKLGLINRFYIALFVPKYEIAIFKGAKTWVLLSKPTDIFYYPDADIAHRKWGELKSILTADGIYGLADFIGDASSAEQGHVSNLDFHAELRSFQR